VAADLSREGPEGRKYLLTIRGIYVMIISEVCFKAGPCARRTTCQDEAGTVLPAVNSPFVCVIRAVQDLETNLHEWTWTGPEG